MVKVSNEMNNKIDHTIHVSANKSDKLWMYAVELEKKQISKIMDNNKQY